jgi:glycosyltransferase involved in cell wall biosynthesis
MRILQVTPVGFKKDIAGLYETQLCIALERERIEVTAISVAGDRSLPVVKTLQKRTGIASELAFRELAMAMQGEDYDVLHAHSATWSFIPMYAFLIDRVTRNSPLVLTPHGFLPGAQSNDGTFPNQLHPQRGLAGLVLKLRQLAYSLADRIICLTRIERSFLHQVLKVPNERLIVIPNGVSPSRFLTYYDFCERHNLPFRSYYLYVGHLKPIKDVPTLLHAFRKVANRFGDLGLVIITYDSVRVDGLERLIAECRLSKHVRVFDYYASNFVDRDLVSAYYGAEALVLPSLAESSPTVILEAYCAQRPVIATAVGGVPETVIDGKTGLLVPPRGPRTLANAIAYMHINDSERQAMGIEGNALIQGRHTWPMVAKRMVALYDRVRDDH